MGFVETVADPEKKVKMECSTIKLNDIFLILRNQYLSVVSHCMGVKKFTSSQRNLDIIFYFVLRYILSIIVNN